MAEDNEPEQSAKLIPMLTAEDEIDRRRPKITLLGLFGFLIWRFLRPSLSRLFCEVRHRADIAHVARADFTTSPYPFRCTPTITTVAIRTSSIN